MNFTVPQLQLIKQKSQQKKLEQQSKRTVIKFTRKNHKPKGAASKNHSTLLFHFKHNTDEYLRKHRNHWNLRLITLILKV